MNTDPTVHDTSHCRILTARIPKSQQPPGLPDGQIVCQGAEDDVVMAVADPMGEETLLESMAHAL